jgi:hypothetical protein
MFGLPILAILSSIQSSPDPSSVSVSGWLCRVSVVVQFGSAGSWNLATEVPCNTSVKAAQGVGYECCSLGLVWSCCNCGWNLPHLGKIATTTWVENEETRKNLATQINRTRTRRAAAYLKRVTVLCAVRSSASPDWGSGYAKKIRI